jgi:LAO/AO transport system kinase
VNWTVEEWSARIAAGDQRALARGLTAIENRTPPAAGLLKAIYPHTGRAAIVGLTGPPGAGKSTLADRLIEAARNQGRRVGVLAVDPSSPYTGGAILGDRLRMMRHHTDPGVFVRSMATRGALGGIAAATFHAALLMDAAGFDLVLVETVGVGQDEVDVARLAHVTIVVLVPGMGDDVQALKAGIMEIAGVFAVNKADRPGARQLVSQIRGTLQLVHPSLENAPPVLETVATEGKGVPQLLEAALARRHEASLEQRIEGWKSRLRQMLVERIAEQMAPADLDQAARRIAEGRQDPFTIADELLERILRR